MPVSCSSSTAPRRTLRMMSIMLCGDWLSSAVKRRPRRSGARPKPQGAASPKSARYRRAVCSWRLEPVDVVHMVDRAGVHLRDRCREPRQQREKGVSGTAERRQMQKIDAPARRRHHRAQHDDGAAEISRMA